MGAVSATARSPPTVRGRRGRPRSRAAEVGVWAIFVTLVTVAVVSVTGIAVAEVSVGAVADATHPTAAVTTIATAANNATTTRSSAVPPGAPVLVAVRSGSGVGMSAATAVGGARLAHPPVVQAATTATAGITVAAATATTATTVATATTTATASITATHVTATAAAAAAVAGETVATNITRLRRRWYILAPRKRDCTTAKGFVEGIGRAATAAAATDMATFAPSVPPCSSPAATHGCELPRKPNSRIKHRYQLPLEAAHSRRPTVAMSTNAALATTRATIAITTATAAIIVAHATIPAANGRPAVIIVEDAATAL